MTEDDLKAIESRCKEQRNWCLNRNNHVAIAMFDTSGDCLALIAEVRRLNKLNTAYKLAGNLSEEDATVASLFLQ